MSREKAGFRDNMALLNEMFPDRGMFNINEAAQFVGCSRQTVRKWITFNATTGKISKADFARQIST